MRHVILSLLLATAAVVGLAGSAPAQARDARIYVDLGDVAFSYGRPYWRYNSEPLYVVYERGYPRYYRYDRGYAYSAPAYGYYAPPVYYAPPRHYHDRPRHGNYGWRDSRRDWDRRDRHRDRRHGGRWD